MGSRVLHVVRSGKVPAPRRRRVPPPRAHRPLPARGRNGRRACRRRSPSRFAASTPWSRAQPRAARISSPISTPDSQSPTSSGARSPASASVRAPKMACASPSPAEPRATPRANAAAVRLAAPGIRAAIRPRMLCASSTAYSSPVMNVANSTRRPRSTIAHLLCVPGSTARTRRSSSPNRADELRLLAAHDVGNARGVDASRAGHDRELAAGRRASAPVRTWRDPPGIRRTALRSSPAGCRSSRRRSAVPSSSRQSSSSVSSAAAKRPSRSVPMPSGALRVVANSAGRIETIRARRRGTPVDRDQGVLRDSVTARDGSRRRGPGQAGAADAAHAATFRRDASAGRFRLALRQRAAASSSLARASTQRAPAGVSSFFQNGARVLR